MEGTGSTLFSSRLFLKFLENWLHVVFQRIVLVTAQIWRELAPHYFPADCFGGISNLAGTGSTLFFGGLFWRQLKFGGNWFHIIFWRIVFKAAQIWRELVSHYFPADCFGNVEGTGSPLVSSGLFWRQLRFGRVHNLDLLKKERSYLEVSIGDTQEHQLGVYLEKESLCLNIA